MTLGTFVRWIAAFVFSLFVAWTGWVISDMLRVPPWLGTALWLSFFVTLYLELVASLQQRVGALSKRVAEQSGGTAPGEPATAAADEPAEAEPATGGAEVGHRG